MAHRPNLIDSETVQYLYDNRKNKVILRLIKTIEFIMKDLLL